MILNSIPMALLSILPLPASKSSLHKPLISSTNHLKPFSTTIPTLGACTPRKVSTTAVSDDAGAKRRIANHHSNLWKDDFIQSLSTHYESPSYRERAEKLINQVKEMFAEIEDGVSMTPLNDLLSRLSMVDSIERLGIDRHFKTEIKSALDYVHNYWSEKGIGCGRESVDTDLNSTALGLRTLRLHGYPVCSGVLEHFKGENGQFVTSSIQTEGEIRSILNLFRASLVAFPNEKLMEDAEIFCTIYLKECLQMIPVSSLSRQIEYVMEYGWHTNLPRLEARHYMDAFGYDEMPFMNTDKLLELAKLDFNIFQSVQQRELKHISRWWKDSGFDELTFARHRHVEFYTLASCFAIDPKHSAFRIGFAKMCHLVTVLDDIYDTFGTMEELKLFTVAVKRWDPSATEWLPQYMKGVYMVLYETVNEMAQEAEKSQGRDTINYARQAWGAFLDSFMKEAEWISNGYLPAFEEYYKNGKVSFGYRIIQLQPTLTLDIPLPHHILQEIDFPSRFNSLASGILRLKSDTRGYKVENARGEAASCISCYMKENPGLTEEEAVNHIHAMVDNLIKELNWEFLKPDSNVPISSKKHAFDITRAIHHGYKYRDGYSVSTNEMKNLVMITVLDSVPL